MANDKNITLGQLVDTLEVVDDKFIDEDELREAQESYDKTSLAYGTCTTAAATAAKVVTVSGDANWKLAAGSVIFVKFSYTNTASNPTINVNGTGAKPVMYNTAVITTSSLSYAGYANRTAMYVYNGTQFVFQGWSVDSNTTYSNASLGQGYGTCSTAAATAAKVVTLSSYSLTQGGVVSVKFSYAVPAGATMNINSKGAKAIYYRGAAITDGIIAAGDVATFIYDGSQYHLLTIDRIKKSASISLAAASWASGSGITDYPYKYTLSVSGVTADSVVELKVDPASMSAASDCGMCPTCDSGSGTVTFYSVTAPTSAITGTLHFT